MFETFSNFILFGRGTFVDLVADIDDKAHYSFSLSAVFSTLSKSANE